MKYLISSDIHGSSLGGLRLKEALSREKPDCLLLLGDLLHGAYDGDPAFLAKLIRGLSIPILAVAGNCDDPYGDEMELGIELPEQRQFTFAGIGKNVHMQHRPFYMNFSEGTILLSGHTHRKTLYEENGVIHCNPGSLALPRDDSPSYGVMDERSIRLIHGENGLLISEIPF